MYDKNSDYALNKRSRDSIVCKSVTGENIHIRREDFLNDEEFEYWKAWSDADYRATEKHDRHQLDNCFTLVDGCDACAPSAEAVLLEHQEQGSNELGEQILSALTETQYRRIKLYYCHKMTEAEIANLDGVGQRRISTSLTLAKKKLEKIITKRRKSGG